MGKSIGAYEKLANRLAETIILFHQQEQVTRQQLAEKFNVSERTVFRDLSRLSAIIEHISGDCYCLAPQYYQALRTRDIRQLLDIAGISPFLPDKTRRSGLRYYRRKASRNSLLNTQRRNMTVKMCFPAISASSAKQLPTIGSALFSIKRNSASLHLTA